MGGAPSRDAAIISADLAPARNASTFGPAVKPPVKLSGFYADDESLPDDLYLRAEDPDTGETRELRVIGVLESSASFAGQIVTSQETLEGLAGRAVRPRPTTSISVTMRTPRPRRRRWRRISPRAASRRRLRRRSSATPTLRAGSSFCCCGLHGPRARGRHLRPGRHSRPFGGGEASADRDDEGPGVPEGQVRLVFLIESSFIALLGIGVGVALGLGFSGTLVDNIREGFPGMEYRVPWGALLLVVVVGYAASLLTTYLRRQASRVYPAEALRYEWGTKYEGWSRVDPARTRTAICWTNRTT